MEDLFDYIKIKSETEKVFLGGGGLDEENGKPFFVLYKTKIYLSPGIYHYIYQTHDWFYYPVRWEKSDWYDKYSPRGLFQTLLNSTGRLFLWIAIILAILSPLFLFFELYKNFGQK